MKGFINKLGSNSWNFSTIQYSNIPFFRAYCDVMNMIYNASAGTGKTWQVTELYSALVLGRPHEELPADRPPVDPRRILLMTFTENAAAELRQRVAEQMLHFQQNDDADVADRARRVLRTLPAAHISTIHAFCAGLLREHALELGISPSFQTLEDEERDALLEEVLKAEIFHSLRSEKGFCVSKRNDQRERQAFGKDAAFREFCAGVSVLNGDYSVFNTIRSLLEKSASRGLDLSQAEAMLPEPKLSVGQADFQNVYDRLAAIDAERGLPAKAAGVFQTLGKILQNFSTSNALATEVPMFGIPPRPSLRSGHPSCGGERFESHPAEGCPQGGVGLERIWQLTKFTGKEMKPISDELAELKERFLTETLYAENVDKFQAFARCLARCSTGFVEAKRARDCVDFGDQLLLARDLLKTSPFDASPFEWIIVDEVQDTSRVQCEVIEALWSRETNLVVCGDKKQSIYAWRSADPDVMPDLEAAMAERGDYRQILLTQSYRSKDRVIGAVNELFEGVYENYDALEPLGSLENEKPCVEFLMADDEEQGSDEEMTAVARRIQLLVNGSDEWQPKFGHDGQQFVEGQSFEYGDILILLKRSTHQDALEKALRTAGIPYSSGGKGRALFEQQEVRDLLLFLQVITQPQNDLALVGFLRSPFVSLPDDEIVQLGWDGQTFDHEILSKQFFESVGRASRIRERVSSDEHKLAEYSDSTNGREASLSQSNDRREGQPCPTSFSDEASVAAERLLRYREQVGRKSPSQLVREVVRETAFDAQLAGQPGGEQKLANFKKALDWLRAVERGGQVLAGDVVRRFEKAIKTPPRSGAAEALLPDPEQNAVTLMTVHGAKGLTKRVCFVPDISFGDVNEPGFAMFSPEGSLELSISALTRGKVVSPGWKTAREADKVVREQESKNVFYVAMTRARDLVVLSGAGTKDSKGWKKMSEGFLVGAAPEVLRNFKFSDLTQADEKKDLRLEALGLREKLVFQPLKIPNGIERLPVTSLVENLKPKVQSLKSPSDRRLFGTLGHEVLEALAKNNWVGDVQELVDLFCKDDSLDKKQLASQLEAARDVLREETDGAEALFAEYPFVLKRDELILDGTMDLLAKFDAGSVINANGFDRLTTGRWKIFDYKFTSESPDVALKVYAPQLEAYKEAVEKLNPGAEVSAALVLINETVRCLEIS